MAAWQGTFMMVAKGFKLQISDHKLSPVETWVFAYCGTDETNHEI